MSPPRPFSGRRAVLALGDGTLCRLGRRAERAHRRCMQTALFWSPRTAGERLVTGGDDGRVVALAADGSTKKSSDEKGKWIDALAGRDDGALAWSSGKQVLARDAHGA